MAPSRGVVLALLCAALLLVTLIAALAGSVALALLLIVLVILLLVLLAVILSRPVAPPPAPPPPPGPPPPTIPDTLPPASLGAALQTRLAGTPADGTAPVASHTPKSVVWVDAGDELLVHLDSLRVRLVDRIAVVALDVETDQTGRTTMVVPLAFGDPADPAGLVAVTEALPRGHADIAARWGAVLREAMWAAFISLANDHASERDAAPRGMAVDGGALRLTAGAFLRVGAAR
jgi:hypothetical protein